FANKSRTLELYFDVSFNRDVLLPGYSGSFFINLLILTISHVQHTPCEILIEGVAALIHRMAGNTCWSASLMRSHSCDSDLIFSDRTDDTFFSPVGFSSKRGTLQYFSGVVCVLFRETFINRWRSKNGNV